MFWSWLFVFGFLCAFDLFAIVNGAVVFDFFYLFFGWYFRSCFCDGFVLCGLAVELMAVVILQFDLIDLVGCSRVIVCLRF